MITAAITTSWLLIPNDVGPDAALVQGAAALGVVTLAVETEGLDTTILVEEAAAEAAVAAVVARVHYDKSNCFKHEITVWGQALNVVKPNDGSWDTAAILNGGHDFLAKKQVRVTKKWYPFNKYEKLEPLERHKLFIQQKADGVKKPPVQSLNAVSVDTNSEISALTSVMSSLQLSV